MKPLLLLILLCQTIVFAAELGEMTVEDVPVGEGVMSIVRNPNESILVVHSSIPVMSFETNMGIIRVDNPDPGEYRLHLTPGSSIITFKADGYMPVKHYIYIPIKDYREVQVRAGAVQEDLPVMIRVAPSGADVKIDGKPTDISGNLKLAIGSHSIEITKSGYVAIRDNFSVNQDNIFFEYTLEKPKLCIVEVSTEPSGAEVSIDGVKLNGTTPISDFYNSGRYPIRITKEKHLPIEETIRIDQSKAKNIFSYRLESNTGTIVIESDPEVNMDVMLNGRSVGKTPLTIKDQDTGAYTISASHEYYTAASFEFPLQRGETYHAVLKTEENFATLTVNTTSGATVYLNNEELNSKKDVRLSPQTARLRAEKPKCETVETTLILRRGARETVDLYLNEQVGTLAISVDPPTGQIELSGDAGEYFTSTGTKIFENIPVGSYELEVSLKGYKTDKRSLRLRPDETLRERVVLEEGGGGEEPLPGMLFVDIPSGSFHMGSNDGDNDEKPVHRVIVSGFLMMTTEVTQSIWTAIMGNNPSNWKGDNLPVEQVSWTDCQEFLKKLNARDPSNNYRLPTEAEWEYACRAGTSTRFYSGDQDSDLDQVGWYDGNSGSKTHPVGQKQPNAFGLYDMHGNIWEWCQDWYGESPSGTVTDPIDPSIGFYRVVRGGGWDYSAGGCRSAYRGGYDPSRCSLNLGFRLVRSYD